MRRYRSSSSAASCSASFWRTTALLIELRIISRALRVQDLEEREDGKLRVLFRRAKNDPFGEGRLAFTSVRQVADWLAWRGPEIAPLFCPIYHGTPIDRAVSPDTVKRLVKYGAGLAGLDPIEAREFSGHSMRVGAAQISCSAVLMPQPSCALAAGPRSMYCRTTLPMRNMLSGNDFHDFRPAGIQQPRGSEVAR